MGVFYLVYFLLGIWGMWYVMTDKEKEIVVEDVIGMIVAAAIMGPFAWAVFMLNKYETKVIWRRKEEK